MFECPKCNTSIPKWKSIYLSNFTKIRCNNCDALLKPKKETMSKIGGWGGGIGAALAMIALRAFGFTGLIITFLILYAIVCYITIQITEFEETY